MSNQEFHLVLGAGQIGPLVAERLVAKGHRVRIARRTAAPTGIAGVENVSLDVRDADAVARAAEGAIAVYNCVNPLYFQWNELLLPMTRGMVDGTAKAGARLVALDCLYMYGDTRLMNERTPMGPVSKKGALRVKSAEYMLEANARGALGVSIGRAADFIGPRAPQSMFGDRFFERVFANKSVEVSATSIRSTRIRTPPMSPTGSWRSARDRTQTASGCCRCSPLNRHACSSIVFHARSVVRSRRFKFRISSFGRWAFSIR